MSENQQKANQPSQSKRPFYVPLIRFLAPLYSMLEADADMVCLIVENKLLVDSRKTNQLNEFSDPNKESKNGFLSTLWVYVIMGALFLFTFGIPNRIFQYSLYFFFLFVMLTTTLISQFSNVLLDTVDQTFLGSKPISDRTLMVAKAVHIGFYILFFSLSLSICFIVGSFYFHGIAVGLLTTVLTVLAAMWSYIITTLLYAFALVHFDGERLKNIIAFTQIFLLGFIIIAYQILGQLFNLIDVGTLSLELNGAWWSVLLFPIWFVAPIDMLTGVTIYNGVLLGLLIIVTVVMVICFKYYGDTINRHLQNLNTDHQVRHNRSFWQRWTGKLLTVNAQEETLYHYHWHFLREDREFKTRLYPSIIGGFVVPAVMIYSVFLGNDHTLTLMLELGLLAYIPYVVLVIIPNIALMIQFSNSHKASWIYQILPEKNWNMTLSSAYKAVLIRLLLPIYAAISLVFLVVSFRTIHLLVLVNGFLIISLVGYLVFNLMLKVIPFTLPYDGKAANLGCIYQLIAFISVVIIGIGTALFQELIPYGKWLLFGLLLILNGLVMRFGFTKKSVTYSTK